MKRIEIKMTDETYSSLVWVLWEWFTWKKIVEYILNTNTWYQLEEITAKYEALKKTQTKLQDIVDSIADIKNMLLWNNNIVANNISQQVLWEYSKEDMLIISKTKEWVPYINNNLINLWNEFKIQVSGYESWKINIEDFEAWCEKRQLSMFLPTYRKNKPLFEYLLSK
jgi:hypothetical protein